MAGMEGYKRPGRNEAAFNAGSRGGAYPPGGERPLPSHEQLVTAIKGMLAKEREQEHHYHPLMSLHMKINDAVNGAYEPGQSPSAKYLFFEGLRNAWDALSYDHYPEGDNKLSIQRCLHHYLEGTHIVLSGDRPSFILDHEGQVALLDAMAEAVGIPHQRGQHVVTLPASIPNGSRGNR